ARLHQRAAGAAADHDRLPGLCPVSAYERRGECRVRPAYARRAGARAQPPRPRDPGRGRPGAGLRQTAAPALRRATPARRAPPRPWVVEPAVLRLDEPLGALDLKLRRQMQDELKAIQRRVGTAFVHVTHDQEEAMALADHCVVMNNGRIEDEGPAERVYGRPASRFSATFMGESTIFSAKVDTANRIATPFGAWSLATSAKPGSEVALAIRPEHVVQGSAPLPLGAATVRDVTFQGSFKRVTASLEKDPSMTL